MNKLFWSAYVVSLIVLSPGIFAQTEAIDDFLGLETEILPPLTGDQKFTGPDLHQTDSWNVVPKNVEVDLPEPNKGQGHSLIAWSTLDPEEYLSINSWLVERSLKDTIPDWKVRLRLADQKELMGKFLQCVGRCDIYRGINKASGQHLSQIVEGDEIKLGKDSVAWIYLLDGSLMRLSSESSVSMQEINIGGSEIFLLIRLNQGHIYWHPRNKDPIAMDFSPETDSISLPLMVREANQQFYERMLYKSQDDNQRLSELMNFDESSVKSQFDRINFLRTENNNNSILSSRVMLVSPNSTIVSKDAGFDFLFLPGGKSYFKKRTLLAGEEFSLYLRGYTSSGVNQVTDNNWYEVEILGRGYSAITDVPGTLQVLELLTKRIKTIELAREFWFRDFTIPILKIKDDPSLLARVHGYSIWGPELEKRINFLIEYTRRIETTNLRSIENLLAKLDGPGEASRSELSDDPVRTSLNHYLLGLKSRYDESKMQVRELNELQYYVWILKNGKL